MSSMVARLGTALGVAAYLAAGCSAGGPSSIRRDKPEAGGPAGAGPSADGQSPEESATPQDGAGGDMAPDVETNAVAQVPFAVDSYFVLSGYAGDASIPGAVTIDTSACKTPRPADAEGNCYRISYRPQPSANPTTFASASWLHPADNAGAVAGRKVAPGATKVSFHAAGETGTERVTLRVGGVQDAAKPHQDPFRVDMVLPMPAVLVKYAVDISAQTYDEVIRGFSWIVTAPSPPTGSEGTEIVFYLDDIRWE